jgi:integrase
VTGRRHFGSVRQRSPRRWQATYWHEGRSHSAGTFPTKADALACLSTIETDLRRGAWIDPRAGQITLTTYANEWLERRPDLAVRTRELYRYLLYRHILPALGHATLAGIAPSKIRGWHAGIAQNHPSTAAKAYRLLSTIMRTAVVDGLILTSPCKVDGAGTERAAERPMATIAEVEALTTAMPERLRLVVLLATWCQLRRGEILGLRRLDIDLMHATIQIEQSRTFTMAGQSLTKRPKTAAGRRSLSVPRNVTEAIILHLNQFTDVSPDALVFTGRTGIPLTRNGLRAAWDRARMTIGRPDLHLHDLRHTGLTLAAATGATTAELMHRAGHSSASAALRYQHATQDRDRVLADALEALVKPATVIPIDRESRASD